MKPYLEKGDRVKLLPIPELMKVLQMRNFCCDDTTRQRVADAIGGKSGIVQSIEDKYAFDYFYFLPDGNESHNNYSIPYQAVDFGSPAEPQVQNPVSDFDDSDWGHLHDTVLNATDKSLNRQQLIELYNSLPDHIKFEAMQWGLSDTCVRDKIYELLEEQKTI